MLCASTCTFTVNKRVHYEEIRSAILTEMHTHVEAYLHRHTEVGERKQSFNH